MQVSLRSSALWLVVSRPLPKTQPPPCCLTGFHNTGFSVCGIYLRSHCRSSCPGEESAFYKAERESSMSVSHFYQRFLSVADQRRRDEPVIAASLASVTFVSNNPEPACRKRSASSHPQWHCCVPGGKEFPAALIRTFLGFIA